MDLLVVEEEVVVAVECWNHSPWPTQVHDQFVLVAVVRALVALAFAEREQRRATCQAVQTPEQVPAQGRGTG